jgi:hypothetical protein
MNTIATAVTTVALFALTTSAQALSFSYALDTNITYLMEPAYGPGSKPQVRPGESYRWFGTLTFETSAAADGTYLSSNVPEIPGRLTSFVLNTILQDGSYINPQDGSYDLKKDGLFYVQIPPYVILKDGQVADLGFRIEQWPDIWVRISGMNATYQSTLYDGFHARGTGTLVPVSPAPEPETYALMLAGIAAIAGQVRRRRS